MISYLGNIQIPDSLIEEVYTTPPNRVKSQVNNPLFFKDKYIEEPELRKNYKFYDDHNTASISWQNDWYKEILSLEFLQKNNLGIPINAIVRKQDPGFFFAPHRDYYTNLVYTHDKDVDFNDIVRMWIPIEDGKFGHALFVENEVLYNWKKGDVYTFPPDALHSAANAGIEPRYSLLVYCKKV